MFDLIWQDGQLRWAHSQKPFVFPGHTAGSVLVGSHEKGFNKTIGKTRSGQKKRFWLGDDEAEARRKAAHILNIWELLRQQYGDDAAWDDETLRLVTQSVHIDAMLRINGRLADLTSSVSADSKSLQLVSRSRPNAEPERHAPIPKPKPPSNSTAMLHAAIDAFLEVVESRTIAPSYRRRLSQTVGVDLKRLAVNCPLAQVDRFWLETLTNRLKARPKSRKTGKPIAPNTVETCLQHWRQFFDWLDSQSESTRFGNWEAPKKWEHLFNLDKRRIMSKAERDASADGPEQVTLEEIKAILAVANERQRMLILTAIFTAQGQSELSVTRRNEFDLDAATFTHRRNKTGQLGVYWLPDILVDLLRAYWRKHRSDPEGLAFRTIRGLPLVTETSDSVRQMFDDVCSRATAPNGRRLVRDCVTFYSFRRYFGDRAKQMGGTDLQSAALAHAAVTMGERHYSNFRDFAQVADVGRAIHDDLKKVGALDWAKEKRRIKRTRAEKPRPR